MSTSPHSGRPAVAVPPLPDDLPEPETRETITARYESRLNDLLQWADEDEIRPNYESIRQFRWIIDDTIALGEASLTMTDAGNIRARWGVWDGQHFAIEFLSGGQAEYALVTLGSDGRLHWDTRVCHISEIGPKLAQAEAAGIKSLWENEGYPTTTPC